MTIQTKTGQIIHIDAEDYEDLSQFKWHITNLGYVRRTFKGGGEYLHRRLLMAEKGQEIDHINRNKLDNRKANLRICTRSENMQNTQARRIYKEFNRYKVKFNRDNKTVWVGSFKTLGEAEAALELAR